MKNKSYAIYGVLFLFLSLVGAIYLSFQNADNRNRAEGGKVTQCQDLGSPKARQECANENGGDMTAPISKYTEVGCGAANAIKCNYCGGFCYTSKTLTCNQVAVKKCNATILLGVVKCVQTDGVWGADPSMNYSKDTGPSAVGVVGGLSVYDQVNNQCQHQMSNGTFGRGSFVCKIGVKGYSGGACTANNGVVYNGQKCFCGTVQIDTGSGHSSYYSDCGCDKPDVPTPTRKPTLTPTTTKKPTPTPTGTRRPTNTPTNTPTPTTPHIIITDTPAPYPTDTPIPTNTPVPTSTPVPQVHGCGFTPCDNGGNPCSSGLVCINANNSNQYCSLPQFTNTCASNPGYVGCCTAPVVEGPTPTRIVLPVSGFEFPAQALTIVGGIATLLGFLILL